VGAGVKGGRGEGGEERSESTKDRRGGGGGRRGAGKGEGNLEHGVPAQLCDVPQNLGPGVKRHVSHICHHMFVTASHM
jgi:hypothetical protein